MAPLLPTINDPSVLRRFDRAQLKQLADEVRSCVLDNVSRTGGHLQLEPRHGRTHGRAAPRLQHAARSTGVGRGPPDLSAQDPHGAARPHANAASARRHLGLSAAHGERVRHLRHRAFVHQHLGRTRHGDGRPAKGRGTPFRSDHRRRRADGRHGLRGAQQRRRVRRLQAARHPQRQRHVDQSDQSARSTATLRS